MLVSGSIVLCDKLENSDFYDFEGIKLGHEWNHLLPSLKLTIAYKIGLLKGNSFPNHHFFRGYVWFRGPYIIGSILEFSVKFE